MHQLELDAGHCRVALGGCALITLIFLGPGSVIHGQTSTDAALAYVSQHGQAIKLLGFMDDLLNTLLAVVVVQLVAILAGRGSWPTVPTQQPARRWLFRGPMRACFTHLPNLVREAAPIPA